MLTGSYNVDKYMLSKFIDIHAGMAMVFANGYCRNIINNAKKMIKYCHIDKKYYGNSILHDMCHINNVYAVGFLIKFGADVDIIDKCGYTPLIRICCGGNIGIAKLLVENDCNINAYGSGGSALHFAVSNKRLDCAALLISTDINVNIVDRFGCTALFYAFEMYDDECIRLLLGTNINVNIKSNCGSTILHDAFCSGYDYDKYIKLLLKNRFDINEIDNSKKTVLHIACINNKSSDCIKLLLDSNININAQDIYLITALHYTCWNMHLENMKLLLGAGADVHVVDDKGRTALHYLCEIKCITGVELLLGMKNIDIHVKDNLGKTALDVAKSCFFDKCVDLLNGFQN
jgi:ankyrin repeat protein